jgi:hypothetical protein
LRYSGVTGRPPADVDTARSHARSRRQPTQAHRHTGTHRHRAYNVYELCAVASGGEAGGHSYSRDGMDVVHPAETSSTGTQRRGKPRRRSAGDARATQQTKLQIHHTATAPATHTQWQQGTTDSVVDGSGGGCMNGTTRTRLASTHTSVAIVPLWCAAERVCEHALHERRLLRRPRRHRG